MKINIVFIILCTITNKDYCMDRENNPFQISKKNKKLTRQTQLLEEKIKYAEDCKEKIPQKSISKLESTKRSLSKNKKLIEEQERENSLIKVLKKTNHLTIPSTDTIQEENEPKKKHKKTKTEKLEKWAEKNQEFINKFHITKEILDLPWNKFLEKLVNIFIPENINYRIIGYNNKKNIIEIPTIHVLEDILKVKKSDCSKKIQELEQLEEVLLEDSIFSLIQLLLFIEDKHALMYTNQLSESLYQEELVEVYKAIWDFLRVEEILTPQKRLAIKEEAINRFEKAKQEDFKFSPDYVRHSQSTHLEKMLIEELFYTFMQKYQIDYKKRISLKMILRKDEEDRKTMHTLAACNYNDRNKFLSEGIKLLEGKNIFNNLNKKIAENNFIFIWPNCPLKISTIGLEEMNTNKLNYEELKSLINLLKIKSS